MEYTPQEHLAVAEVLIQYAAEFLSEGKTEEADEMMELSIERKKMAENQADNNKEEKK